MKNIKSSLVLVVMIVSPLYFACSTANESRKLQAAQSGDEKISDAVGAVMDKLAQPTAASFNASSVSNSQVKVDSAGNIQCYIFLTEINEKNVAAVKTKAARFELMDETAQIIQAWIPHRAIPELAALPFVIRISPPDYGRPLSQ